jgi:tetratricopeptide (TPR) repeat protein
MSGAICPGERGAGVMKRAEHRANAASFHAKGGADSTQAFDCGFAHHRAGRLVEAEACYRRVLAAEPDHLRTLHLLGLLCHQAGRQDTAAELLRRAITRGGANARLFSDLGAVLKQQGRLDEAADALRQAVAIEPDLAQAHCNLSAVLREQGKIDEAIASSHAALRTGSARAEVHVNLGVLLCDKRKFEEAVAAFTRALAINPSLATAHFNLGHALREQGRRAEAAAAYRQVIRIMPRSAEAYSCLGALLHEEGRLDEAVAACQRAIRLKPNFAEAYYNLAIAFAAQKKFGHAAAGYRKAIEIRPDYAEAHSALGTALRACGKLDEAIAAYRRAITLKPSYAEAHCNLGRALHDQGKSQEAIDALRNGLLLNGSSAEAHNSLGLVLRAVGKLSEGHAAVVEAIRLAPFSAKYRRHLSEMIRFRNGDKHLLELERLLGEADTLALGERTDLHFALGKAYDDVSRHAEAAQQWLQGNALKRREVSYDAAAMDEGFERIRNVFAQDWLQIRQGAGHPSAVPVFIIGMPRSGTTLVEQILASHHQVFGSGEMKYFADAVRGVEAGRDALYPEVASTMRESDFADLGRRYLTESLRLARPGALHVTDKMPSNFLFAGLIHLSLPNAPIIHTVRDPVDTCLSCFSKLFTGELNYTYDLAELGRYYRQYQLLMAHWKRVLPAGRILDVSYEDLVEDVEGQARRIVAHCGLGWDARCLSFQENDRPVRTASATQVRQPVYKSSVGRWRPYRAFLAPLLQELGVANAIEALELASIRTSQTGITGTNAS